MTMQRATIPDIRVVTPLEELGGILNLGQIRVAGTIYQFAGDEVNVMTAPTGDAVSSVPVNLVNNTAVRFPAGAQNSQWRIEFDNGERAYFAVRNVDPYYYIVVERVATSSLTIRLGALGTAGAANSALLASLTDDAASQSAAIASTPRIITPETYASEYRIRLGAADADYAYLGFTAGGPNAVVPAEPPPVLVIPDATTPYHVSPTGTPGPVNVVVDGRVVPYLVWLGAVRRIRTRRGYALLDPEFGYNRSAGMDETYAEAEASITDALDQAFDGWGKADLEEVRYMRQQLGVLGVDALIQTGA